MREHDGAGHAGSPDLERHREQRLVDLVGALQYLVAVRIVQRVGRVVRLGR